MRRAVKGLVLGAAVGLAGAAFEATPFGADFEKNVGLARMFAMRGPIEAPKDVSVVAISGNTGKELSLPALPRDWPRSTHARVVENLVKLGASVIVFDVDFQRARTPEDDLGFARAVKDARRVVLVVNLTGKRQPILDGQGREIGMTWVEQPNPPIAPLAEAAVGLAPFPVPKVQVAIYEFWAFKTSAGDAPTLPAAALQVHALRVHDRWIEALKLAGAPGADAMPARAEAIAGAADLETLMQQARRAFKADPDLARRVTDAVARAPNSRPDERRLLAALADLYGGGDVRYLNFYGPPGTIETIPYHLVALGADRRDGKPPPDLIGKVVFVGFSDLYDPGQPDRFYTVFTRDDGVDLSGVEIAATAFANLLNGRGVAPADPWIAALIVLAFGLAVGGGAYLLPAIAGVPAALAVGFGYGAAAQYAFSTTDLWLPLATPVLLQLPAAVFVGLATQYLLERRQKQRVTRTISYYLPESVAKTLAEREFDPASLNKIVLGTCLATDMAGFTSISERLGPEELASFMNAYFEALAEPLKRHKADVTEFHADTIMCAWLTPEGDAAARRRAALAALEVVRTVGEFGRDRSLNKFTARVGLENSRFYLGHAGGGGRLAYSILGDCANTASRLEGLNKQLGTHLLATQSAVDGLDDLLLRSLGLFRFVGKSEARPVLEVLAPRTAATTAQRELCDSFAEALDAFQAGRWPVAAGLFETHLGRFAEDGPAEFFLARCRKYQTEPPADDPAIIRLDSK